MIKKKLSKGIIKVDELTNVVGNTDFVKFIANICEQTTNFFHKSSAFWSYFFLKSCLKVLGAAYTRVFTIVLQIEFVSEFNRRMQATSLCFLHSLLVNYQDLPALVH